MIITRFILEGVIEIGLSAMITIIMLSRESVKNPWEVVSTMIAFISLIGLIACPFILVKAISKYKEEVEITKDPKESEDY